jgi:hypothetical protein
MQRQSAARHRSSALAAGQPRTRRGQAPHARARLASAGAARGARAPRAGAAAGPPQLAGGPGAGRAVGRRTWAPRERHRRYPSANGRPSRPSAALVTAPMRAPPSSARPNAKRRAHHHRFILGPQPEAALACRAGTATALGRRAAVGQQRRAAQAAAHRTCGTTLHALYVTSLLQRAEQVRRGAEV